MDQKASALRENKVYIMKFTAPWCRPCRRINPVVEEWSVALSGHVQTCVVNIDEELDIYSFFKRKRILRGVPAILAWVPDLPPEHAEYQPHDSVCSGDVAEVDQFYQRVAQHCSRICEAPRE